jgi:hypothetical protein
MIKGNFFEVDKVKATFFEFEGNFYGRHWQLFPSPGCKTMMPATVAADDTAQEIIHMVEEASRKTSQGLTVTLSSHYAILFYLGGGINEEAFKQAEEVNDTIRIANHTFGEITADLVIVDVRTAKHHVKLQESRHSKN